MPTLKSILTTLQGGSEELTRRSGEVMDELRQKVEEANEVLKTRRVPSDDHTYMSEPSPIPYGGIPQELNIFDDWTVICRCHAIKYRDLYPLDINPPGAAHLISSYVVRAQSGLIIPAHAHKEIERIHVISGSVQNLLTRELTTCTSDRVIYNPSGILHGFVVLEDSLLITTYSNG